MPEPSYVSCVTVPFEIEADAPAGLDAERRDDHDSDRIECVVSDDGLAGRLGLREARLHLRQSVTVVHRGQDAGVLPQEGLVLELEVLGECHEDPLGDGRLGRIVPGGHVDGDRGQRARVDTMGHVVQELARVRDDDATGRRARGDDPDPKDQDGDDGDHEPETTAGDTTRPGAAGQAAGELADPVSRRTGFRQDAIEQRADRAQDDEAGQERDLGPEFVGLGRHQECAGHGHQEPEHDPPDPTGRHRLGVGDHEEQEDQDLR